jgi:hypothetical protein
MWTFFFYFEIYFLNYFFSLLLIFEQKAIGIRNNYNLFKFFLKVLDLYMYIDSKKESQKVIFRQF